MKFFAVFAAVLALAAGTYTPVSTWTLPEIEAALQDPATNPATIPYLINGLNTIVANLHAGVSGNSVVLSLPIEETVTLDQLLSAIHDPSTDPAVMLYLEEALKELLVALNNGQEEDTIVLSIPALNINVWTLDQLSAALQNPETDPELMVYLEHAINNLMAELFAGNQVNSIVVITPPGVIVTVPETVSPVAPAPVFEESVVAEAAVKPESLKPTPPVASSPLVQVIVNINTNQQEAVAPTPVVNPTPVRPTPVVTEPTEDGPHIAVNPAGWEPNQDTPVIAVGPWA